MIYTKASLMICILVTMQQSQANQFQYPAQIPGANVGTNYQHSDPCDSIIKGVMGMLRLRIGLMAGLPFDREDMQGLPSDANPSGILANVWKSIQDPALRSLLAYCLPGTAVFPPRLAVASMLPSLLGLNAGFNTLASPASSLSIPVPGVPVPVLSF
ncbi:uncharacterized protein LOC136026836 [Artemia franciscana]